jgi:thiol-disulfide isomerase/thioredoxin
MKMIFRILIGAAALLVILLCGPLQRRLGAESRSRRSRAFAVLAGVVVLAMGLAGSIFPRQWLAYGQMEGHFSNNGIPTYDPNMVNAPSNNGSGSPLSSLAGATGWINSKPLTASDLKGKVVLVDFWTYSCINCLRSLPYMNAWAEKYKQNGLVIIGVHAPEFPFEKEQPNVEKAVRKFAVSYPVALDNNYAIWKGFSNQYWPAHYFFDAKGKLRHQHFGEGDYVQSELWIQKLLQERASQQALPGGMVSVSGQGEQAAALIRELGSPETYIGYEHAQHFASAGGLRHNSARLYAIPDQLKLNEWGLGGLWKDQAQTAVLTSPQGTIAFRFHARDLHLVLGPAKEGTSVRFRITIDGQIPGPNHGVDTDEQGNGVVISHRLYQLVRQKDAIEDRTFIIEFLDPGVQAYAFTFG